MAALVATAEALALVAWAATVPQATKQLPSVVTVAMAAWVAVLELVALEGSQQERP